MSSTKLVHHYYMKYLLHHHLTNILECRMCRHSERRKITKTNKAQSLPSRKSGSVDLEGPTSPDLLWALPGGVGHGPDSLSLKAGLCSPGVCSHCRQQGAWMPRRAAPLLQGNRSYVTVLGSPQYQVTSHYFSEMGMFTPRINNGPG